MSRFICPLSWIISTNSGIRQLIIRKRRIFTWCARRGNIFLEITIFGKRFRLLLHIGVQHLKMNFSPYCFIERVLWIQHSMRMCGTPESYFLAICVMLLHFVRVPEPQIRVCCLLANIETWKTHSSVKMNRHWKLELKTSFPYATLQM